MLAMAQSILSKPHIMILCTTATSNIDLSFLLPQRLPIQVQNNSLSLWSKSIIWLNGSRVQWIVDLEIIQIDARKSYPLSCSSAQNLTMRLLAVSSHLRRLSSFKQKKLHAHWCNCTKWRRFGTNLVHEISNAHACESTGIVCWQHGTHRNIWNARLGWCSSNVERKMMSRI